jgi:hypothetical protein
MAVSRKMFWLGLDEPATVPCAATRYTNEDADGHPYVAGMVAAPDAPVVGNVVRSAVGARPLPVLPAAKN